jgi:hypothetical protein
VAGRKAFRRGAEAVDTAERRGADTGRKGWPRDVRSSGEGGRTDGSRRDAEEGGGSHWRGEGDEKYKIQVVAERMVVSSPRKVDLGEDVVADEGQVGPGFRGWCDVSA